MGVRVDTRRPSLLTTGVGHSANKQPKGVQTLPSEGQRKCIQAAVESRIGPLRFRARYHCAPKVFDSDYIITGRVLGSGASGDIVTAEPRRGRGPLPRYAVKRLALDGIPDWKLTEVRQEVAIALCMDHPLIARLYDVYEESTQLLLVFECLDGGELYDRLVQKERLPEEEARDVVHQMLLMLGYIHGQGVAHRDLKLENFVYASAGGRTLKMIDFGLAAFTDSREPMRSQCGTLRYAAPEVLRGSYTMQCDIWSMGVVAYILLSGTMPFRGSKSSVLQGTFQMQPSVWEGVSHEAQGFVREMLQVNPHDRPNAQAALGNVWIQRATGLADVGPQAASALHDFPTTPKLRRIFLRVMALSLSAAELAELQRAFLALDSNCLGTVSLASLERVLTSGPSAQMQRESCSKALEVYSALLSFQEVEVEKPEVQFSEFLAAVLPSRCFSDALLRSTFQRFDTSSTGGITAQSLSDILGDAFDADEVASMFREADLDGKGILCYPDFAAYLGCPRVEPVTVAECNESPCSLDLRNFHAQVQDARCDYPPSSPFKRIDGDRMPASRSCCGDVDVDASCSLQ